MSKLLRERLQVHMDFGAGQAPILLGECAWYGAKQVVAFEWDEQALTLPFKMSPFHMLPQRGVVLAPREPFGGLHGMLSDSIPDGFGLRMMNNALKTAGHLSDVVTPIHRLAWVGNRGLGALTYAPAISDVEPRELVELEDLGRHAVKADVDNFADIPEAAIRAGGSAHGARPKFWAQVHGDGKTILLGDGLSTRKDFTPCLVKFPPARGDKNEPYFEAACLQLANEHSVQAANARLLHHPAGAALAVERFDRTAEGGRIFTQSLAALVNDDFRLANLDYENIFQVSRALSTEPEGERIYRQACFNVALSMKDDHSKNFAFLMGHDGIWVLSPAFDLCPSEGPAGWQTMSVSGESQRIGREHLLKFANTIGLSLAVAKDGIDQARAAALAFEPRAISLGATKSASKKWATAFKAIDTRLAPTQVSAKARPR